MRENPKSFLAKSGHASVKKVWKILWHNQRRHFGNFCCLSRVFVSLLPSLERDCNCLLHLGGYALFYFFVLSKFRAAMKIQRETGIMKDLFSLIFSGSIFLVFYGLSAWSRTSFLTPEKKNSGLAKFILIDRTGKVPSFRKPEKLRKD